MITFRNLKEKDYELLHRWIKTNPYVKKWYYLGRQPRLKTLENKIKKRIADKEKWCIKIAQIDGVDFGYIQAYPVDGNGNWTRQVKVYDYTVSLDYFIGNIDYIHKGYGSLMINSFIDEFLKEKYDYAMISPDPINRASIRTCEKCGFNYIKTVNTPNKNSTNIEAVYIKKL